MKKKVSIALGSGGARGIAHIGVLEVLEKNGFVIDEISGSSIGAIIGALYASGVSVGILTTIAVGISLHKVMELFDFTRPKNGGIVKGELIEEFLEMLLPVKKFKDLKIKFSCTATDLETGKPVVFNKGDLIPAIRASISIPGFFVPYKYKSRLYIDGGVTNPVPVDLLKKRNFKIAVVVDDYSLITKFLKARNTLEEKIKDMLNERFYPVLKFFHRDRLDGEKLNFLNVMTATIDIMRLELAKFKVENTDADLVIQPDVKSIGLLAFHEGGKSYKKGIEAADSAVNNLKL